ncbi:endolytic transglycosylase MltG [Candidatus Gracilibacteria bacterium]|nr:endolytic transglycosylase MltG [Candidatus Gracilibacteria bacterium]
MSEQKKQSIFFRLFKLIIWIGVIGVIFFYSKYSSLTETVLVEKTTTITIEKGDYYSTIHNKFKGEDGKELIDKNLLKIYLKFNPQTKALQAGSYKIKEGTKFSELFEQLNEPIKSEEITVTILEGWNIFDIDEYLTNRELIEEGAFMKYARTNGIEELKPKYPFLENAITLEGFLYPDSYRLFKNQFSPEYLATKMLDNFETKVYEKILQGKSNEEILEIVNIASILEKEEKSDAEKPTVAGILKKRYEDNWMIGADITVCYPHDLTAEECKLVVTKYINEVNEYNTRTKTGLPKTPIGNPQFSSVEAVVNPKDTPHWFYLHNTNTGKIYYATTNAEHEYNKANYLYR